MARKTFTVYFVQPDHQDGANFDECLQRIAQISVDQRNLQTSDGPVRIQRLDRRIDMPSVWEGDVIRTRLHEPGAVANSNGTVRAVINDEANEGMGEVSAFCYDSESNVLLYQSSRAGASVDRFGAYVSGRLGLQNIFTMGHVIRPDSLGKVASFQVVRGLEVSIAKISNPASMARLVPSLSGSINMIGMVRSTKLAFRIAADLNTSLERGAVRQIVDELLAFKALHSESVRTLEVRGSEQDGGAIEPVDLVNDILKEKFAIEGTPLIDEYYFRRRDGLRGLFEQHMLSLRRFYRRPNERRAESPGNP